LEDTVKVVKSVMAFVSPILETAGTTFIGAFVGVWAALKLEKYNKAQELRKLNLAAGKKAQFTLVRHLEMLAQIRSKLTPLRDDELRHVKLGRLIASEKQLGIDVPSLVFLLDEPVPDLLYDLVSAEQLFQEVIWVMHLYDNAWIEIKNHGLPSTEELLSKPEYINEYLNSKEHISLNIDMRHLEDAADALYRIMDLAFDKNCKAYVKLDVYLGRKFSDYTSMNLKDLLQE
jgi:hypothetical protein